MAVILGLVAVLALVLGVVNLVQMRTGQQLLGAGSSSRAPEQVRRDSRWAAVEYLAGAGAVVAMLANQLALAMVMLGVAAAGYVGLLVGRRR